MFSGARVLCFLGFLALTASKSVPSNNSGSQRQGRWFGYQYTSTEIIPKLVTSLIPSSCVQIEASIPPCRNVRNLEFPRFLGGYRQYDDVSHEIIPSIHTTKLGWGEYLGIYAPTVTVTALEMRTTTVLDPRTVVTFSVKGCKPSRLPMDLSLCPSQTPPVIPDIEPTSTATNNIPPTAMPTNAFAKPEILEHTESEDHELPSNNLENIQTPEAPSEPAIAEQHPSNQFETQPLQMKSRLML